MQKTGRGGGREDKGQGDSGDRDEGSDLGGVKVTPIRTVQAGVFRFETWIEEGKDKFEQGGGEEGKGNRKTQEDRETSGKGKGKDGVKNDASKSVSFAGAVG